MIAGRARDQRLPHLLGFETFTTLHERQREAVRDLVILRRDGQRAAERRDRAIEIARRLTRDAKVQMNGRERRPVDRGALEFSQRARLIAALPEV